MAQRRMIDKRTIQTQKFLRLPLESQALYFHLMLNADDDGVVEAFPIVRMVGAAEDSLGLLVVKQFIKPLNDEMVYFIVDFKEQNTIRKDTYKPSKYADLIAVDEPLTERQRAVDVDKNRLDKNRLDKNNILSSNLDDVKGILSYLNEKAGTSYRASSKKTQSLINARFNETFTIDDFKRVIDIKVAEWGNDEKMSKFLRPETLFGPKFESYLNQKPVNKGQGVFADPNAKFDVNDRGGW
ncbi:DNA replication protein [Lactococcus garvieae]|uniref:conserved phage C-terminal domain-containing protein n=1 Tax=Lactococcus TaxID=1357 RepID=UPI000D14F270|nr:MULTISPECIES: conserved phage C-terminal domain-containing protein [Lactococcus]USI70461.1 conserved phage C-terminal domain-containing protein [Lactococcus garvieae subsp. garvieae]MDT2593638.1 conserved phage C-terminal domain-containing protein [Lactococcus petauri]PST73534.1 DNA replication protein [Lactococcus garvieae]QQC57542.1 conserved phage C-terminal domain-containing protein [Lactococcus garvieae]UHU66135.1 DNA replication protein [Lactococcus garvieae]